MGGDVHRTIEPPIWCGRSIEQRLDHAEAFMGRYGHLTSGVPVNIYAIAKHESLIDFPQYTRTLAGEVEFVTIADPAEFGLRNVEGALLTGERHIVTDRARAYFET